MMTAIGPKNARRVRRMGMARPCRAAADTHAMMTGMETAAGIVALTRHAHAAPPRWWRRAPLPRRDRTYRGPVMDPRRLRDALEARLHDDPEGFDAIIAAACRDARRAPIDTGTLR
jgi:hypothetical protein